MKTAATISSQPSATTIEIRFGSTSYFSVQIWRANAKTRAFGAITGIAAARRLFQEPACVQSEPLTVRPQPIIHDSDNGGRN
jgi:hypothetical protein